MGVHSIAFPRETLLQWMKDLEAILRDFILWASSPLEFIHLEVVPLEAISRHGILYHRRLF